MKLRDIEVIYEDVNMLVVNKPSGLLSVPDRYNKDLPCLAGMLKDLHPGLMVVHRLDRETSGALVFAKTAEAHSHLNMQFQNRKVEKWYWLLTTGQPPQSGTIDVNIAPHPSGSKMMATGKGGKPAQTAYETIRHFRIFSLVKANLLTGRTHQLRVHFAHIGHEIVGDTIYGSHGPLYLSSFKRKYHPSKDRQERPLMNRLALHARTLSVEHPQTGEQMRWEAPLPKDFRASLNQLEKWG
ncbi:MAG: RluA family pseudouridine synthase [Saprospirales bacterium]|nr:MAG: RluA family pseudouridine synthase [Saprospirales bacterium]